MDKYYEIGMPHNPFLKFKEYGQIITSRGCPAKCYFCSVPDFNGSAFRYFSAKRIINDIENWINRFRNKNLGEILMNFNNNQILRSKHPSILQCKKKHLLLNKRITNFR